MLISVIFLYRINLFCKISFMVTRMFYTSRDILLSVLKLRDCSRKRKHTTTIITIFVLSES